MVMTEYEEVRRGFSKNMQDLVGCCYDLVLSPIGIMSHGGSDGK